MDRCIIGRREHVAFPEWGVKRIVAKVDTGARTSALDVEGIELLPGDQVRFDLILRRAEHKIVRRTIESALVRQTIVKPSSGIKQDRLVVSTLIRIGEIEKRIEITLVSRRGMRRRMLLGRTALSGDFLVDPDASFLHRLPVATPSHQGDVS